jgi:hypothetical protein
MKSELSFKWTVISSEEEEMNFPTDSDEKLLIQRARSDDGDTSDSENNDSIRNGGDTSNEKLLIRWARSDDGSIFD